VAWREFSRTAPRKNVDKASAVEEATLVKRRQEFRRSADLRVREFCLSSVVVAPPNRCTADAGGDGLDDLDQLEADSGLCRLVRAAEAHGRGRRERRTEARRWRRQRLRALPSRDAAGRWLAGFHDAGKEARRQAGRAFIPASSEGVVGLWRVNGDLLRSKAMSAPETITALQEPLTRGAVQT
jgi:hypothetical protein